MFGIRRGSAILRVPADGDGGAGGGGTTPAFTEEQQAAIGQIVNQAVTGHLKRSLPGAIGEGLKAVNWKETLGPVIAEVVPKPAEGSGGGSDDDKGKGVGGKGGKGADSELERRVKDLADKLEASEAKATAADKARLAAEQQRLLDGATTQFRNALQPKVRTDPGLLDVVVSHFGREHLKVGDDGKPLLRVKRAQYKGGPEQDEEVSLEEGLPILLATETMKSFLPAPGGNGGGGGGKGGGAPIRQPVGNGGADLKDPAARTLADLQSRGLSEDDL